MFPVTYRILDPNSSTNKFDPTSSVCVGVTFKIPTLDSVRTRPYTRTSSDSDSLGIIVDPYELLSVYASTNSPGPSRNPMATLEFGRYRIIPVSEETLSFPSSMIGSFTIVFTVLTVVSAPFTVMFPSTTKLS